MTTTYTQLAIPKPTTPQKMENSKLVRQNTKDAMPQLRVMLERQTEKHANDTAA